MTIQSRSPRSCFTSPWLSVRRRAAATCDASPRLETRVLGRGGSSSRMRRRISSNPAPRSSDGSKGCAPAKTSYRTTPSEYTSVRVSTSRPVSSACSGLMYSGVPIHCPSSVKRVRSVSLCDVALATPKSMIFGTGRPSSTATRMLDGLMSRWITPFWWACCTPPHTWTKTSNLSRVLNRWASQYSVSGTPLTNSITK